MSDDDDPLARIIERNRRAQVSMGAILFAAGVGIALWAVFGYYAERGFIPGIVIAGIGAATLVRGLRR